MNEEMKLAWLEISEMLGEPTEEELDVFLRTWQRASQATRKALAEQPAQQEPKIDIYRSFEQWKRGNVLEHGVPRTEYYSEAQLDLVEMGWNYGYDAGRAVEQALDKKAENARELGLDYESAQQEPVAWRNAAIRVGEDLCSVGPFGYYDMTAEQWLDWALSVVTVHAPPAQRTWVGLTDEQIWREYQARWPFHPAEEPRLAADLVTFARAIEAAHGIKENT